MGPVTKIYFSSFKVFMIIYYLPFKTCVKTESNAIINDEYNFITFKIMVTKNGHIAFKSFYANVQCKYIQ